jgi:hypothetical protein
MTIDDLYLEWLAAQNAETAWFESNRLKLNLYRRYLHDIDQRMVEAHPQLYPILLSGKAGERECSFIPQFTVPIEASDLCVAHIADLPIAAHRGVTGTRGRLLEMVGHRMITYIITKDPQGFLVKVVSPSTYACCVSATKLEATEAAMQLMAAADRIENGRHHDATRRPERVGTLADRGALQGVAR